MRIPILLGCKYAQHRYYHDKKLVRLNVYKMFANIRDLRFLTAIRANIIYIYIYIFYRVWLGAKKCLAVCTQKLGLVWQI